MFLKLLWIFFRKGGFQKNVHITPCRASQKNFPLIFKFFRVLLSIIVIAGSSFIYTNLIKMKKCHFLTPCLCMKKSKFFLKNFFIKLYRSLGVCVLNLRSVSSLGPEIKIGADGGTLSYISGLRTETLKIWSHILFLEHQMSIHAKLEPANIIIDSKTHRILKMSGKYFWDTL